ESLAGAGLGLFVGVLLHDGAEQTETGVVGASDLADQLADLRPFDMIAFERPQHPVPAAVLVLRSAAGTHCRHQGVEGNFFLAVPNFTVPLTESLSWNIPGTAER